MSEVEVITACENVCRDFYWLSDSIMWLGDLITDLGPLIALGGAIYIYYKKSADERKELRRDERRKVYADFLRQCQAFWNETSSGPVVPEASTTATNQLHVLDELRLLAPEKVYDSALELQKAYVEFGAYGLSMTRRQWLNKNDEQRSKDAEFLSKITSATNNLVSAMKKDLEKI